MPSAIGALHSFDHYTITKPLANDVFVFSVAAIVSGSGSPFDVARLPMAPLVNPAKVVLLARTLTNFSEKQVEVVGPGLMEENSVTELVESLPLICVAALAANRAPDLIGTGTTATDWNPSGVPRFPIPLSVDPSQAIIYSRAITHVCYKLIEVIYPCFTHGNPLTAVFGVSLGVRSCVKTDKLTPTLVEGMIPSVFLRHCDLQNEKAPVLISRIKERGLRL